MEGGQGLQTCTCSRTHRDTHRAKADSGDRALYAQSKPLRNPPCLSRSTSGIHYRWNSRGRSASLCSVNHPTSAFSRPSERRSEVRPGREVSYEEEGSPSPTMPRPLPPLLSDSSASQPPPNKRQPGWCLQQGPCVDSQSTPDVVHSSPETEAQGSGGATLEMPQRPLECDVPHPMVSRLRPFFHPPAGSLQVSLLKVEGGMAARQTRPEAGRGAQSPPAGRASSPALTALPRSCGRWAHCGL